MSVSQNAPKAQRSREISFNNVGMRLMSYATTRVSLGLSYGREH